ncbi:hypothetical protein BHE74_00041510 [Ensete ventricosum]|nr:hypothetical protein BHE74_00041510 [Ensete ventricosum]
MALKFLNKKGWHTGSLQNIENVWKAEQKHDAEQRKLEELRKQIQDEHEKSELRLRQEQAGLVPLDFLYESGLAVGNGSSDGFKALQAPPAAASTTSTSEASSSKFLPLSTKRTANSFATDGLPLELLLLLYAAFAVVVAIVRSFSRCLRVEPKVGMFLDLFFRFFNRFYYRKLPFFAAMVAALKSEMSISFSCCWVSGMKRLAGLVRISGQKGDGSRLRFRVDSLRFRLLLVLWFEGAVEAVKDFCGSGLRLGRKMTWVAATILFWVLKIGYDGSVLRLEGCPKDDVVGGNEIGRFWGFEKRRMTKVKWNSPPLALASLS